MKRIIPLILLATLLTCPAAWAADVTAAMDINSAYVWRGLTANDGLVAQPSIDVSAGGFGINVWGNFDIGDYDDRLDANNFSEIDLTLSYGFSVQKLEVGVGVIEYLFIGGGSTREAYVSLGYPIVGGLSAGLSVNYDFDAVHGYYSTLSLTYAQDLMEKLGLEIGAHIGYVDEDYAEFYSGGTEGGLYDYAVYLSLSYAVTDAFSIGATITATDSLNEDTLPDDVVDKTVIAGVNLSYSF
jgi:uncharacterized protein (TIGR02001 family)